MSVTRPSAVKTMLKRAVSSDFMPASCSRIFYSSRIEGLQLHNLAQILNETYHPCVLGRFDDQMLSGNAPAADRVRNRP